jgi:hypothetical protein
MLIFQPSQTSCLKALHSNLSLLTIVNDTFICTPNNRFHSEIDEGAVQSHPKKWTSPGEMNGNSFHVTFHLREMPHGLADLLSEQIHPK